MSIFNGIHYAPSNKTAALSFTGERHISKPTSNMHWEICPPLDKPSRNERNLTGIKFGRFTVVGKMRKDWTCPEPRWVVRCSCGDFEVRKSKAITNPNNNLDRCVPCRRLVESRRNWEWHATGTQLDTSKL